MILFFALAIQIAMVHGVKYGSPDDGIELRCSVCRDISSAFDKGLSNTSHKTYPGGNYEWEHGKLKPYQKSEIRLIEVLESICPTTPKPSKCFAILSDYDEIITEWWISGKSENETLESFICVSNMQVCCPYNKYGKECSDCVYSLDTDGKPCSGHGKCKGNGTRTGTGKCDCEHTYKGDDCSLCIELHYLNPETKSCMQCDESCIKSCSGATSSDCEECKEGWERSDNGTCVDLDECSIDKDKCKGSTYCVNEIGSFSCKECDPSCDGCTGSTGEDCIACNTGYELINGSCSDIDECVKDNVSCTTGTFCMNTLGNYSCEACDASCADGCSSSGPESCNSCAPGYKFGEDNKLGCQDEDECVTGNSSCITGEYCINSIGSYTCKKCHKHCKSSCVGSSIDQCSDCAKGYTLNSTTTLGCVDFDECASSDSVCEAGQYCVNKIGYFKCKQCHKSCEICHSSGSRSCISCSSGYTMKEGKCRDRKSVV